jgi:hypothetical protein
LWIVTAARGRSPIYSSITSQLTENPPEGRVTASFIKAVNDLTARWAYAWDGGSTVMSALGVWPLLAMLADPAEGAARDELAGAVGLPAEEGLDSARSLLNLLEGRSGLGLALGLWTRSDLAVREQWTTRLPDTAHEVLDGDPARAREALDAWVDKRTGGLLREMPVRVDADTQLLLASALSVNTRWKREFSPEMLIPEHGPWAGRRLVGLSRLCDPSEARVVRTDGNEVTLKTVFGASGTNVILALGEEGRRAGDVLRDAVRAAASDAFLHSHPADLNLEHPGPGLTVSERPAEQPGNTAELLTTAFNIRGHHDLLSFAELFGLESAADKARARFPGISAAPLFINGGAQDATAAFSAEGFVAAAATAIGVFAGGMPRHEHTAKHLTAKFDRPFGFLAVDRPTGLILACGWVADPQTYPDDAE